MRFLIYETFLFRTVTHERQVEFTSLAANLFSPCLLRSIDEALDLSECLKH